MMDERQEEINRRVLSVLTGIIKQKYNPADLKALATLVEGGD